MKWLQTKYIAIAGCLVFVLFLGAGVFAANNLVLNSGNSVELGAGAQRVNPCDDDVNLTPIVYNDGYNSYIQGFQYDNVNKAACVGYDIETRFVSNTETSMNAFTTSSIASEPNLVRVFAPSSSATWRLGLGAYSTEVTVTQISASSFKVIFTTPIALVSDFGRFVMAELTHLPLGTFTGAAQTYSAIQKMWLPISMSYSGDSFYVANYDQTVGQGQVYKSGTIGTSFASTTLTAISALPGGDGVLANYWYEIDQSESGKYVIAVGGNKRAYFSTDFGTTWDSMTAGSYSGGSGQANTLVSMSADGQTVCMVSDDGNRVNIWKAGSFYTKSSKLTQIVSSYVVRACKISPDGTYLFVAQGNDSGRIYKMTLSGVTSSTSSLSGAIGDAHNYYRLSVSEDGTHILAGYKVATVPVYDAWTVSNDGGTNFYSPSGLPTSSTKYVGDLRVSLKGKNMVVTEYDGSSSGGLYYSTDYGRNFTGSGIGNSYFERIGISSDGNTILAGGYPYSAGNLRLLKSD